jgi:hypothetical protein
MREFQPTQEARPDGVPGTVAHYLPSLSGLSLTLMAGHLLIGAINPLLLVPAGLAVTAMLHSGKVQSANDARARGELMQHIRTVLTQVRVMIPGSIHEMTDMLKISVADMIAKGLDARRREIAGAITEAARTKHATEPELAARRATVEEALKRLKELSEDAAELTGGWPVVAVPGQRLP